MNLRLDGRAALVTGARRGLGRAIAAALVQAGARVAISHEGERDRAEAEATAAAIGAAHLLAGDLSDPAVPAAMVAEAARRLGGLGILVCNAAVDIREDLEEIHAERADLHWAVNVRAMALQVVAARPLLAASGHGRVLLLGSVQAAKPNARQLIYASTKAAIVNAGRNFARQFAPDGIAVNILLPGAILTGGNERELADAEFRAGVEARIPMGRIGRAEDVAGAAVFLCSDAASYVTGAELRVDGGLGAY